MSEKSGLTGGQWMLAMLLVVGIIAGLGGWLSGAFTPLGEGSEGIALAPATTDAEPAPEAKPDDTAVPKTTEIHIEEPEGEGAPSFDVVRVDADGNATVAGRAAPGSDVVIELDGKEAARLTAGPDGSFAGLMSVDLTAAPRVMRLRTADEAPTYAALDAIVAPTAPPATQGVDSVPAEPAGDTENAAASDTATSETADTRTTEDTGAATSGPAASQGAAASDATTATTVEAATETTAATPAQQTETETAPAQAPAVLMAGNDGVTVMQPAGGTPQVMTDVAIDAITYSETGDVQLSGRGKGEAAGSFVRVYLDNKPITTSRIAPGGDWRTALPDVDTGVYTLRVDQVDAEGQVVSRVETPFKREEKARVSSNGEISAITVQPGHTLWAIARDNYGDGVLYVRLFEANRDQIRNPDLIYPGQVFDIPRE